MAMDMTVKEYFEDEENMNRVVDELIAEMKPYNDKYIELLENKDNIFNDMVDCIFKFVLINRDNFDVFDLYDYGDESYEPKTWNEKYSLFDIDVMYDMLISMAVAQKTELNNGEMFLEAKCIIHYSGRDYILEKLYGQGERHKTITVVDNYNMYTNIDLKGLRKYWEDQQGTET